jgi:hypothetical protein
LGDSNPIEMLNKVMGKLNKTIDKNIPKSKPRNTFEERNCSKHQEKTSTMGKVFLLYLKMLKKYNQMDY